MSVVLQTQRLILREIDEEDAAFVLRLLNEPAFLRFVGDRGVRDLDDARRYVRERFIAHYRERGFGLYAVVDRAADAPDVPLGICGLVDRDALDDVDLGFAFLPEHRSRGYARESAEAVLEHAREELGLARVVAVVQADNRPSVRLLEKLGFRREGSVRLGEQEDEVELYGLDAPRGL